MSGSVIWKMPSKLMGDPVHELICNVLMEERSGDKDYVINSYAMKWLFDNKLDLVFAVVYQKSLQLLYIDQLLTEVKSHFLAKYEESVSKCISVDYASEFKTILRDVQLGSRKSNTRAPRSFSKPTSSNEEKVSDDEKLAHAKDDNKDNKFENLKMELENKKKPRTMRTGPRKTKPSKEKGDSKKGKKKTKWNDGKLTKAEIEELDHSKTMTTEENEAHLQEKRLAYIGEDEVSEDEYSDSEEESDSGFNSGSASDASTNSESARSWSFQNTRFGSFLQQISGNKTLTREDLSSVMDSMRNQLVSKNVASEVADELSESVITSLVGQKLESFTRVSTVVKKSLEEAILRIITPKKSTDVLREVQRSKAEGKPYSIVFVGVNGVGKSTSLSKVCYYLKSRGVKVMMAACDTFRSGAVEQLNQHAKVLDVPLFQKGYAKDPSSVARDAIRHANDNDFDCVLIDTAGRMQNNEPLMRALAKLVSSNDPNLVLFVGEALVGNDGIDQLKLFNQALADYSDKAEPHVVDGIVLTKFDTIDDKVGAAVSMVYETGQPVMFVGTGQKYTNLKKLNVRTILRSLVQ